MLAYAFRRLLWLIPTLLGAVFFVMILTDLLPGDPADVLLGPSASEESRAALRERLQLDRPLVIRYGHFVWLALRGDLGNDLWANRPVASLVLGKLSNTLALGAASIFLAAFVGIPLGAFFAMRAGSAADSVFLGVSLAMVSIPDFVVGLILLFVFAVRLRWFPLMGAGTGLADSLHHLVLPAVTLSLEWMGYVARIMRGSMLDVLSSDYVKTERSFGAPARVIWSKYALRNAVAPAVSTLGMGLGKVLGGAVFVEVIFSRPGIGNLLAQAIASRDLPVIQGSVLVTATFYVLANLAADLSYAYIDPRIRYD